MSMDSRGELFLMKSSSWEPFVCVGHNHAPSKKESVQPSRAPGIRSSSGLNGPRIDQDWLGHRQPSMWPKNCVMYMYPSPVISTREKRGRGQGQRSRRGNIMGKCACSRPSLLYQIKTHIILEPICLAIFDFSYFESCISSYSSSLKFRSLL